MKHISILLIFLSTCVNAWGQRFDDVVIKASQLSDHIYMLEGAGGNVGVFVGPEGTLVIDSQFADLSDKIKAAIQEISDSSIVYLVNTHWHGDHVGGNHNFAADGVTIIAQTNVRKRMSIDQIRAFRPTKKASPIEAWPTLTFEQDMEIHMNGESIQLLHIHNAHTDGDAFVYFPMANVLHMGDCFFKDRFPFIDRDSGGSVDGAISAVETAMMICDEETKIIPGHGSEARLEDLRRYLAMYNTMKDRVKNVSTAESTIEDLDIESLTEGFEDWGTGFINGEKFVTTLLKDLYKEKP